MTDILTFRSAVASGVATAIPSLVESKTHGGRFDAQELKRWSSKAPGARTCVMGVNQVGWEGGQVVASLQVGTYLCTKGADRDAAMLALVNQLVAALPRNSWGLSSDVQGVKSDTIAVRNLYSSGSDKAGVSLWAVTWRQRIDIDVLDPDTLDDFATMQTEYDLGGDELDNTETTTTLETDP